MSARNQIRDAVAAVLVDVTDAEKRVTASRLGRVGEVSLPEIVVNLGDESSAIEDGFPGGLRHELAVLVEVTASGPTGLAAESAANEIHDQARAAIAGIEIEATVQLTAVTQARSPPIEETGLAIVRLGAEYTAVYFTLDSDPSTLI